MNKYLGVIHGDLHLNNATLKELPVFPKKIEMFWAVKNPTKLFVLDDDYQFIFPTTLYSTAIIDFSRSIIHPDKADVFKDDNIHDEFPIITNRDVFSKNQREYLLELYLYLLPDMASKKDDLSLLLKNNFDACFNIMTLLDLYNFCLKLNIMFGFSKKDIPAISPKCKSLLKTIITLCEHTLVMDINKMIQDSSYAKTILQKELPIMTIMKKVFADYLITTRPTGTLVDIWILKKEMQYSNDTYENMPPHITDTPRMVRKELRELLLRDKGRYLHKLKTQKKNLAMVKLIARRHKEKISFI